MLIISNERCYNKKNKFGALNIYFTSSEQTYILVNKQSELNILNAIDCYFINILHTILIIQLDSRFQFEIWNQVFWHTTD